MANINSADGYRHALANCAADISRVGYLMGKKLFRLIHICMLAISVMGLTFISGTFSPVEAKTTIRKFSTIGARSCEQWLKDKEEDKSENSLGFGRVAGSAWVAGYVSGVNEEIDIEGDLLADVDLQTIIDWTDHYCHDNPAQSIRKAIAELFIKLNRVRK